MKLQQASTAVAADRSLLTIFFCFCNRAPYIQTYILREAWFRAAFMYIREDCREASCTWGFFFFFSKFGRSFLHLVQSRQSGTVPVHACSGYPMCKKMTPQSRWTRLQEVDAKTFSSTLDSKRPPDGGVSHLGEPDLNLNLKNDAQESLAWPSHPRIEISHF